MSESGEEVLGRAELPSGMVTFLMTDVVDSTRLFEDAPKEMCHALARHDTLIEKAAANHGGHVVRPRGEGDSRFLVFARASDAAGAGLAINKLLEEEDWSPLPPLRVRMALHTGEADLRAGDYYGRAPNRCARLRAMAHPGQVLCSEVTALALKEDKPDEAELTDLGWHRLADLSGRHHIYQLSARPVPSFPPQPSLDGVPHNLPMKLTRFVGRDSELTDVAKAVADHRVVTLTGLGGVGKSRLALHVAAEALLRRKDGELGQTVGAFEGGAWLVELGPMGDAGVVVEYLAGALRVHEEPATPLEETLVKDLRGRETVLVVFDDCEQVLDSVAQLIEHLVGSVPDLRVLSTSRAPLGVAGEYVYRVSPLRAPQEGVPVDHEELAGFEAVELFVDRARRFNPMFTLSAANASPVAELCARLEGIPLAIELAAPRLRALSPNQLSAQLLDDRFRLLTDGPRGAADRHKTLRATMDWSYRHLTEPEQLLLRRLSVFSGGFSLEAAEKVGAGDDQEEADVLPVLIQLVDKSLVMVDTAEPTRYRLLETVRQFVGERLDSSEFDRVRDRHLEWSLLLSEQAPRHFPGSDLHVWLDRLHREYDNLRAALDWAFRPSATEDRGPRMVAALHPFWLIRGRLSEGERWLERGLAHPAAEPVRAELLRGAGNIARASGRTGKARSLWNESAELARSVGDKSGLCAALANLGRLAAELADFPRAQELSTELLEVARDMPDADQQRWDIGAATNLALVAQRRGDYELASILLGYAVREAEGAGLVYAAARARLFTGQTAVERGDATGVSTLEEALAAYQKVGNLAAGAWALNSLGALALEIGQRERASALLDEAMELATQGGDPGVRATVLHTSARLQRKVGHLDEARMLEGESLALRHQIGDMVGIAECLEALAGLDTDHGNQRSATRRFGAAEALRKHLGAPVPPSARNGYERDIGTARAGLDGSAFTEAWEAGRKLDPYKAAAEGPEMWLEERTDDGAGEHYATPEDDSPEDDSPRTPVPD